MKLILITVITLWAVGNVVQTQAAIPTGKDISLDEKGQLVIKGWLETREDYTITDSAVNKVFSRGENSVTYGNEHLLIKKRVSLEENKLKLFLQVIPCSEAGRTSDFFLHVRFKKPFQQFYKDIMSKILFYQSENVAENLKAVFRVKVLSPEGLPSRVHHKIHQQCTKHKIYVTSSTSK